MLCRPQLRTLRLSSTAALIVLVATACGGGSIKGLGPGDVPGSNLDFNNDSETRYGVKETAVKMTVEKKGDLLQFIPDGSTTAFVTAKLSGNDQIGFAYKGKLYLFSHNNGDFEDEIAAGSSAGSKVASGSTSPGATVGFQTVGDDDGAHMLTIHGKSQVGDDEADFSFASCGTLDCADQPSGGTNYTVKTGNGQTIEGSLILKNESVASDGRVDWLLTRKVQLTETKKDEEEGDWGRGADYSGGSDRLADAEPLPEVLPTTASSSGSSSDEEEEEEDEGLFGWVSELFTWKNLLIGVGIAGGAWLAWETLDVATNGSLGDGKFFGWCFGGKCEGEGAEEAEEHSSGESCGGWFSDKVWHQRADLKWECVDKEYASPYPRFGGLY